MKSLTSAIIIFFLNFIFDCPTIGDSIINGVQVRTMLTEISTVTGRHEKKNWNFRCDNHQVDGWIENATPPHPPRVHFASSCTPIQSSVHMFIVNISIIVCGGNHWALVNSRWQRCERVSNNWANKGPNSRKGGKYPAIHTGFSHW